MATDLGAERFKLRREASDSLDLLCADKITYSFMYMYGIMIMKSISYTAARSNLAKTMEQVCDDHAPIAITRKGEGAVVMMSMEDYQALEETAYLLRSPKNARRLIESIAELEAGRGVARALAE
jgi:antitoxin YefM